MKCASGSMDRASDSGSEGWGFESLLAYHIKEQSLIQKQPSKSEGCFCIYARKAHNIRLSGLFLFSGDLVD